MSKNILVKPVVKWVGGKRQLLDEIIPHIPKNITTYVEPFIGGGAVFFDLQPKKAIINDFNKELINVYNVIKNNPEELISLLVNHKKKNNEDYFYSIRELDRDEVRYGKMTNIEKAARVLYLNKTCYNGLFRVNMAGQFNTPFGRYKNPDIVNKTTINALSDYFKNDIEIHSGDYAKVLQNLDKKSFVYFDPPYMPVSISSSFTGYTNNGFDENEQLRLKNECDKLTEQGIPFMLSNSDVKFITDLYGDYNIRLVKAKRSINSKANKRGEVNEVIIDNFELIKK